MDFLAVTRLFLHVTLVVDLRERDVLQPLFFLEGASGGGSGGQRGCSPGSALNGKPFLSPQPAHPCFHRDLDVLACEVEPRDFERPRP